MTTHVHPKAQRSTALWVLASPGLVVANNALVNLSPTGKVCIFTLAASDYVLDITGWTTESRLNPRAASRFMAPFAQDTRHSAIDFSGLATPR